MTEQERVAIQDFAFDGVRGHTVGPREAAVLAREGSPSPAPLSPEEERKTVIRAIAAYAGHPVGKATIGDYDEAIALLDRVLDAARTPSLDYQRGYLDGGAAALAEYPSLTARTPRETPDPALDERITRAYEEHGHHDDWGIQVIYLEALLEALNGPSDD